MIGGGASGGEQGTLARLDSSIDLTLSGEHQMGPPDGSRFRFLLAATAVLGMACGDGAAGPSADAIASIEVSAAADTLRALAETVQVTAVARSRDGRVIEGAHVSWTSAEPMVVSIAADGVATAVGNGRSTIRAISGGVEGTAVLVVQQAVAPVESVLLLSSELALPLDTIVVTFEARDARGNPVSGVDIDLSFGTLGGTSAGTFLEVVERDAGTYQVPFVAEKVGSPGQIRAILDGTAMAQGATFQVVGFSKIAAGGAAWNGSGGIRTVGFTCGILTTGVMYCWGAGYFGVLGIDSPLSVPNPVPQKVLGGQEWIDVAVGNYFACGVTTGRRLYCWGDGDVGEIGNGLSGNPPDVRTPTPALTDSLFRSVSIGYSQGACALTLGGSAMCWGGNAYGRIGNGSEALSAVPVSVHGGLSFAALSTDFSGTCGVTPTGTAYCWGSPYTLGASAPDICALGLSCAKEPVEVSGGTSFRPVIARGPNVACAGASDGGTYCWGSGYLGDGTSRFTSTPTRVSGGLEFVALSAGDGYQCGITARHAAYCWGRDEYTRLGTGTGQDAYVPTAVLLDLPFKEISTGSSHTCGITIRFGAYCWGGNDSGELGDGTFDTSALPRRVRLF